MRDAMRRLTLSCDSGLANRMRVLVSGRVIARAAGAELEFLWPLHTTCGAAFERLFEASPDVRTVTFEAVRGLPAPPRQWGALPPDLLADPREHVTLAYVSWLLRPATFPAHAALWPELAPGLAALVPTASLRERVAAFQSAHFRPFMIGVHLRRGDFHLARPDVIANTDAVIARIGEHIVAHPDAGILLATDDGAVDGEGQPVAEGVRGELRRRFGERVVSAPLRSLDRNAPEAIEDALVELLLLRQTHAVIGTRASSFSELAAFGRDVPFDCPEGTPERWRRLEHWARRTGAYPHIMRAAQRFLGHEPDTFFQGWRAMRHAIGASRAVMTVRELTGIKRRQR